VFGAGVQDRRFQDPLGEVGLGVDDQKTTALDGFVGPRVRFRLWRGAFLHVVAQHRSEGVFIEEANAAEPAMRSGDSTRSRFWFGSGVELEQFLASDRVLLAPAVHVDTVTSRFAVAASEGELGDDGRDATDLGVSPRLGTRFRIVRGLEARASVGRYFRPPNLMELFGDRGFAVGNPGLVPERGTSVDGGFVVDLVFDDASLYAQAAGFWSLASDLVQWVRAGPVTRAENLDSARIAGFESSLSLALLERLLVLGANYTFVDSQNRTSEPEQHGQPLPGRPRHELFVSPSVGAEMRGIPIPFEPRVLYTLEVVSGTFLDPSARYELPTRVLHGFGVELHLARMAHLAFEVRNLLDARVTTWTPPIEGAPALPVPISDFIGYPLPGRSLWASLSIDLGFRARRKTVRTHRGEGSSIPGE
jgi:iron complex outermembrane receptor protein